MIATLPLYLRVLALGSIADRAEAVRRDGDLLGVAIARAFAAAGAINAGRDPDEPAVALIEAVRMLAGVVRIPQPCFAGTTPKGEAMVVIETLQRTAALAAARVRRLDAAVLRRREELGAAALAGIDAALPGAAALFAAMLATNTDRGDPE